MYYKTIFTIISFTLLITSCNLFSTKKTTTTSKDQDKPKKEKKSVGSSLAEITVTLNRTISSEYAKGYTETLQPIIGHLSMKSGDVYYGGKSFSLSLYDRFDDGIYSTMDGDRLYVLEYQLDTISKRRSSVSPDEPSSNSSPSTPLKDSLILKVDDYKFMVKKVDGAGNYIVLKPLGKKSAVEHDIFVYEQMPQIEFELFDGSRGNTKDYLNKGKLVYIDFWGTWCPPCVVALSKLQDIQAAHPDKLTVIGMNAEDIPQDARDFVTAMKYDWVQGFATNEIRDIFCQTSFPFGILFDEKGKVIKIATEPEEIVRHFTKLEQ